MEYTSLAAPIYASWSIDSDTYSKNYQLLLRGENSISNE
jgi:hypothetical protein